jgi:acetate---CoA ligase (ADP-forming)
MNAPAAAAGVDVILRDGRTLRLRAPDAGDRPALQAFLERLSARSRYLRFHATARPGETAGAETIGEPDWDAHGALVAVTGDDGARVVGLATYDRLRDPCTAEAAFVVDDEWQGQGVGTRLLEQLAAAAAEVGVERFVAEALRDDGRMLRVFEDAGFAVARTPSPESVEVRFSIAPTADYVRRVDERDHVAVTASLRPFFAPRSVAVVGASPRRGTIGGELFRNVLTGDFAGVAHPVNRGGEPVAAVRAWRTVADIPDPVDLVVVCVPGVAVLDAAREALAKGVKAICVISAGFAETGEEGRERQRELLDLVRTHGARLIGPNCLGVASNAVSLNATFAPRSFPPGRIAFSSQSGALGLALLARAEERGLGLSAFVSVGNKADVSSNDLLEYWEDDPATDLVALYLESFGNPRKFARIARRVSRTKPILAMKSGTTAAGARAAGSHTAALAGSEAAVDALFRQTGVLRAGTLGELVDLASLLSSQPLPAGRRVAILTNAGGLGILCADACQDAGLELAALAPETRAGLEAVLPAEASVENPIDMLGSATADTYRASLGPVLADPGVDATIVLFAPPVVASPLDVAAAIRDAAAGATDGKPLVTSLLGGREAAAVLRDGPRPVTDFAYPESAARAVGRAAGRADWLRRPEGAAPALERIDRSRAEAVVVAALAGADDAWLDPDATRDLLDAYGIPVVAQRIAADPDEAVAAADELGYPAVVKTAAAGAHKTETGGVLLDLRDADAVRAAAERIGGAVIVQPMLRGGVELLAGIVQDPVFGPVVAFGPGGVLAELIGDATVALPPLTDVDVEELVARGKAGRLVAGFRGAPPADRAALADALHRLGALADDLDEVAELDVNPLIALPDGVVAVDARVRVVRAERRVAQKTW